MNGCTHTENNTGWCGCPKLSRKRQLGLFLFLSPALGAAIMVFQLLNMYNAFTHRDKTFFPKSMPTSWFSAFNIFTVVSGFMLMYQSWRVLDALSVRVCCRHCFSD